MDNQQANQAARKAPRRLKLCIARVVGIGSEEHETGTYLADISVRALSTGLYESVFWATTTKHRILEARNKLARDAVEGEADYILFLDPDMDPNLEQNEPGYKPFLETATEFLEAMRLGKYESEGMPAGSLGLIAAPALSGPPEYKVNVFMPDEKTSVRRVTQREGMEKKGSIERVAGIGTAVMLIPTEMLKQLPGPWFDDVYRNNEVKDDVWVTQDIYFCNKVNAHGFSVWCSWYAWAGHVKRVMVGRPDEYLVAKMEAPRDDREEEVAPCEVPEEASAIALEELVQAAGQSVEATAEVATAL